MNLTRKEFLSLSSKAAATAALVSSLSALGMGEAADDIRNSAAVRKIHDHIAREKEKHIANVRADLRQPSVSSWNMGIKEMADRMIASFRAIGCNEVELVPTDGLPGIWAYHDAGAPKTMVIYMMYDTQPWEKERWSVDPLSATRTPRPPFPEVIVGRGAVNDKGPNRFFPERVRIDPGGERAAAVESPCLPAMGRRSRGLRTFTRCSTGMHRDLRRRMPN